MEVTPEDAKVALDGIQQARGKARHVLNMWAYSWLLWGVIWVVGFLVTQFWPQRVGEIWNTLDCIGVAGTVILIVQQKKHMRFIPGSYADIVHSRMGPFYVVVYSFVLLWLFILHPIQTTQMTLFLISVAMFTIVMGGVWLRDAVSIAFGVVIMLLALPGYYLFPSLFWLWETVFAGLPLVGIGIYYLRRK